MDDQNLSVDLLFVAFLLLNHRATYRKLIRGLEKEVLRPLTSRCFEETSTWLKLRDRTNSKVQVVQVPIVCGHNRRRLGKA
jgi:hypothetical protein